LNFLGDKKRFTRGMKQVLQDVRVDEKKKMSERTLQTLVDEGGI
jgi:hypothetical protein